MPVERTYPSGDACWGLWKITETEAALQAEVPEETVSPKLIHPLKRLEFLAGRALISALLKDWSLPFHGIQKDSYGKPSLLDSGIRISLSHSYPFVAAILHRRRDVGIDLEQPKDKLLRIAPRVLSEKELQDAGDNMIKHCVYWCAKETLIKIYGKKDLILSRNLFIEPFPLVEKGYLIGRILVNDRETAIPLEYHVADGFVVVVSR